MSERLVSIEDLSRLIGTPACPQIVDVRIDEDVAAVPRAVPTARRRAHDAVAVWAPELAARPVVVVCHKGLKLSQGVAALLRLRDLEARALAGGMVAWSEAGLPTLDTAQVPPRGPDGTTLWVTRERPKIDRIACPWLIRRFVDPDARFLFVAPDQVALVAERFGATPFDIESVALSHRGERCSFDTMLDVFGLSTPPLPALARIIRGADTARPDLAPEAAGLLAASLGLSAMIGDDLAQLEAGMTLYDAFYAWAREEQGETHTWPSTSIGEEGAA